MRKHALRRSLLSAAATATIIGAVVVPSGPAFAAGTGTVTGHLTDPSGQPLVNAAVHVSGSQTTVQVTTDASGAYTASGLDAGSYAVSFVPAGARLRQYAHQKRTWESADHFVVAAGATVVVDDQALAPGWITGALHQRDGSPATAHLTVYTGDEQIMVANADTAADGTFSLELLPGEYKIQFYRYPSIEQWNGGTFTYTSAAPIAVVAGQVTPLQESVIATGSIAGQLLKADGTPAAGVSVGARTLDDSGGSHATTTGADGRYRLDDVPVRDDWLVSFGGILRQYAHGKLSPETADRVAVTEGQTSTVDDQLLPTGSVRVIAHDATTGAPLSGFCTWVNNTSLYDCAETTEVVLSNIYVGTWYFDVGPGDGRHFDAYNKPVTVVAGQTSTLDVALGLGATLTVPMLARAGGAAAGGCLQLGRVGDPFPTRSACSGEGSGPIVVGPLQPGTYQVFADPGDDALGAQWVGATGGTGNRDAAAQFTVAAGDQLTIPAVQLDGAGSIRGTVTDAATGAPVPHACVSVVPLLPGFNGDGCPFGTAEDGTYTLRGLGPYAWPVEFAKPGYQWRWSGNKPSRPEATTVTVRVGKNVRANIKLRTGGGTVAGTAHDAAGHPVDVAVLPFNAVTGEAVSFGGFATGGGGYSVPLLAPQQSVKLRWTADGGRSGWVGGTDFASATAYPVKNNKTTTVNITVS
ncbi:carboxypeptidase regulatory-like domain-containing protein [Dactylosporangium sp. CA-233914]|uniref:carboxypeptidase-like regulatory domain-containing protein n=1 Tax=Dactylosporangium sp. CA-233914 TaxID=3239934 RepID=UPI003D8F1B2D